MNSFDCRSLDSYYLGEEEQHINPIHLISTLENDPENGIVEMVQFLRCDDFRIVRIGPSPASRKNQRFIENRKHPQVSCTLADNQNENKSRRSDLCTCQRELQLNRQGNELLWQR